jgi:hypothetical protein
MYIQNMKNVFSSNKDKGVMMRIIRSAGLPIVSILTLFMSLALSTSQADAQVPDFVEIESLEWAGSGCPPDSVVGGVADDKRAFSLGFSEYLAEIGPGVPRTENRKNCNLILRLNFPQGWSFTIFEVNYRGFASLDRKVVGTQRSAYFFEGQFPSVALRTNLVGVFEDNYEIQDTLGLNALVWSPCGLERALNVNTEVRLDNRKNKKGSGIITTDTIDGELEHIYGIRWRRCE